MAATLGLLLRPFCFSITRFHNKFPILQNPILSSSSSSLTLPRIQSLSITYSSNSSHNDSYPLSLLDKELNEDQDLEFESEEHDRNGEEDEEEDDDDYGSENGEGGSPKNLGSEVVAENTEVKNVKLPNLTVKEKKELASYAHGLGKKLKCQLVGKSGVTDNVIFSFLETLEANELLKIKIHRTCPGELEDVVSQLEQATGSVVVGQIGRTVIIYKPSLTKMKAEEKKKEFQRAFIRRQSKLKPTLMNKGPLPRFSGRGRRGTSRV
ncbi:stress response protein NST1 [Gossypium australe]|uniref:Stress response protein NST1 n=1 Tax=Gossypium australe TaxID=47621 RepID=A0A5B6V1D4_9ROSI|nr:stress response protein NST1 [Gossypium australe]